MAERSSRLRWWRRAVPAACNEMRTRARATGFLFPGGTAQPGELAGVPFPYRDSPLPVGKTGARPAPDRCSLNAASSSPTS